MKLNTPKKYTIVIDASRCIDCKACMIACKVENNIPEGSWRNWIRPLLDRSGERKSEFQPGQCMQCDSPSCVAACPVDATYKAINTIVNTPNTLLEFSIHAITEGIDALGEVTVRVQGENGQQTMDAQTEIPYSRVYGGHGADTDIIVASAKAYINALNKLIISKTEKQTLKNDYGVMLVG